ncbi:GrpB family protein [Candidatus Lariskella endosymbiont of Hedychridium roseum]|uniref:GrpB family protein n=1 Tax=Candidatus Lariskella endosymbiont of Hedychridium roseum TaxID=3077949 RepID=UPI0030D01DB9
MLHHVGSTSVPGLAAKPKIDIMAVVLDLFFKESQLEAIGYRYRGGFNIPLRRYFTIRAEERSINLHVFEENDPEIELNILFRDHLCRSSSAIEENTRCLNIDSLQKTLLIRKTTLFIEVILWVKMILFKMY